MLSSKAKDYQVEEEEEEAFEHTCPIVLSAEKSVYLMLAELRNLDINQLEFNKSLNGIVHNVPKRNLNMGNVCVMYHSRTFLRRQQ